MEEVDPESRFTRVRNQVFHALEPSGVGEMIQVSSWMDDFMIGWPIQVIIWAKMHI